MIRSTLRKLSGMLARMAGPERAGRAVGEAAEVGPDGQAMTVRRWDAAITDRLNSAHWERATGQSINLDLASDLATLRARSCYEASTNPIVEGVISTHAIDLVGPTGPTLQVQSESEPYNAALQDLWAEWWDAPTACGTMTGMDWLQQCVRQLWTKGEVLAQLVPDPLSDFTRVLPLDPDRLVTPLDAFGDRAVCLGVRRNTLGRPIAYNIQQYDNAFGLSPMPSYQTNWISADDILHLYEQVEPGQARGVPWLASSLQEIADLRDYDTQTLDAARAAAHVGVYFYSTVPEACSEFRVVSGTSEMSRRTEKVLPPGYQPMQINPGHPSAQYVAFRHEKMRAIGRPAHMPLLLILLSAEQSNFSQSRIDVNVFYERGLASKRNWLANGLLNPLVSMVATEGMLSQAGRWFRLPRRPRVVRYRWVWDPLPQADPRQWAESIVTGLTHGWITYPEVCALLGKDEDDMIRVRTKTNEKLAAAGLPPVPGPTVPGAAPAGESEDDEPPAPRRRAETPARDEELVNA